MKRADRQDSSHDNSINNPQSKRIEPVSPHELKIRLMTIQAQRDEWKQLAQQTEEQAKQNHQLYLEEQQRVQQIEVKVQQNYQLYLEEQQNYQSTLVRYEKAQSEMQSYLTLYNEEKARSSDLLIKYEQVKVESQNYLALYNEAQAQLKLERKSKAGIKGWETRRKRENERLKQEIGEMAVLLRDSLARKDEAIDNLEVLAERMDRLQFLVNSVEGESTTNPVNFLQKVARIWQAIKDILAE